MDAATRTAVLVRAAWQCEYCRRPLQSFELDHVVSRCRHGSSHSDNLAASCETCNGAKGERAAGELNVTDPLTGRLAKLFHPREMRWSDHFAAVPGEPPRGSSSTGRATAAALFTWRPSDIRAVVPERGGDLPWLTAHRLATEWDAFDTELQAMQEHGPLAEQTDPALEAQMLHLQVQRLYTESSIDGLSKALRLLLTDGREVLATARWRADLGIVLRQLGTLAALRGTPALAERLATAAFWLRDGRERAEPTRPSIAVLRELRERSYVEPDVQLAPDLHASLVGPSTLRDSEDWRWAFYCADILAANRGLPQQLAAAALERLDLLLLSAGYGQSFDRTRGVMLARRRWHLAVARMTDLDATELLRQADQWRTWRLFNEVRHVLLALERRAVEVRALGTSRVRETRELVATLREGSDGVR